MEKGEEEEEESVSLQVRGREGEWGGAHAIHTVYMCIRLFDGVCVSGI